MPALSVTLVRLPQRIAGGSDYDYVYDVRNTGNVQIDNVSVTAAALAGFDGQPDNWRYTSPRRDRLERQREKAEAELTSRLTQRHKATVESDRPDMLLAALARLADDGTDAEPVRSRSFAERTKADVG